MVKNVKCKSCEYLKEGRTTYWCTQSLEEKSFYEYLERNPKYKGLRSVVEVKKDSERDAILHIKTSPMWCPLRKKKP